MPPVRPATPADTDRASDTLAAAFADYPFTRHTVSAEHHTDRLRTLQRLFVADVGLPHGVVHVSDDVEAVAVWTTPRTDLEVLAALGPRLAELAGERAAAHASAENAMGVHRPQEPVWFLGTVGVHPRAQGRGLGRAVVAEGLRAADCEGVPAFLETSLERNVRLYERLGFVTVAAYDLPDGGPRTWSMRRPVGGAPA